MFIRRGRRSQLRRQLYAHGTTKCLTLFTLCIKFDFHKSFSDTREEHDLESGNLSSTTDSEIPPSRASLWSSHRSQDGTWEYFSTCGLWAPLESSHETESRCRGGEPSK